MIFLLDQVLWQCFQLLFSGKNAVWPESCHNNVQVQRKLKTCLTFSELWLHALYRALLIYLEVLYCYNYIWIGSVWEYLENVSFHSMSVIRNRQPYFSSEKFPAKSTYWSKFSYKQTLGILSKMYIYSVCLCIDEDF